MVFRNRGDGQFDEVAYGIGANRIEDGRAVAVADFDRDGRLDIVVHNFDRPAVLLMGRGESGHWLQVALRGAGPSGQSADAVRFDPSHCDAVGAIVTIETDGGYQRRQVKIGSGYLGCSSRVLHFGLGDADRVKSLTVRWPSGQEQLFDSVPIDQRIELREPMGREGTGDLAPASH